MSNIPPSTPRKQGKLAYAMDPRNRIKTLMFLGAAGVSVALVGYFVESNSSSTTPDVKTAVAQAPSNVKFVNGASSSKLYKKMYDKQVHVAANKAVDANKSYIPGFLGKSQPDDVMTSSASNKPTTPPKVVHLAVPHIAPPVQPRAENVSLPAPVAANPGVTKEMGALDKSWGLSSLSVVYSALPVKASTAMSPSTAGHMVDVNGKRVKGPTSATSANGKTAPVPQIPSDVVIGAGRMEYGVLDVQLNSNRPTPVLAEVEDGPLAGARLLGSFKTEDNRLVITFTMASLKNGISFPIKAVMVNPKVNQAYLASSVNHHYLYRYGMLLGGSFLAGFGQTLQQSGSTTTDVAGGVTQTFSPKSIGGASIAALGQVGATVGQIGVSAYSTPNTVRLNLGQGIGILFLKAVTQTDIAGKAGTGSIGQSSGQKAPTLGKGLQPVGGYANNGYSQGGYGGYNQTPVTETNPGLQVVTTP